MPEYAWRVLFEGAFANFNPRTALQLDFKNEDRAPLLLIAGGADHVVPASIDEATSKRFQQKSTAVTDYKEFPDRSHFTVGPPGWEEVADYAHTGPSSTHRRPPPSDPDTVDSRQFTGSCPDGLSRYHRSFHAPVVKVGHTGRLDGPDLLELDLRAPQVVEEASTWRS